MKLNGSVLVAVVTMVGSMALATGCNKSSDTSTQPESVPAPIALSPSPTAIEQGKSPAPAAQDESVNASVRVGFGAQAPRYAPSAPPAPRYEVRTRAPSARHFWVNGHWSHNGREWVWIGGHWNTQRAGYTYVSPHWNREHGHYRFMHGHWVRRHA